VASPTETAKQQAAAIAPPAPPPAPAVAEEEAAPPKARSAKPPAKPAEKKHAPAETKTAEPAAPLPPPLRELPDNIQREIPPLKVGGYIYSGSKADRTVIINGRLLHEGEEAAPGLILEKMMPNGMVLNYRGYRYRSGY
jgi:general secretion pathway protein B